MNFPGKRSVGFSAALNRIGYRPLQVMTSRDETMLSYDMERDVALGPDGHRLTLADLPPPGVQRWVTRRKAEVVAAVRSGILTLEDACQRYELSKEEFAGWERLYERHGVKGLRTTRLQTYR